MVYKWFTVTLPSQVNFQTQRQASMYTIQPVKLKRICTQATSK
jgi:hypothetical protein